MFTVELQELPHNINRINYLSLFSRKMHHAYYLRPIMGLSKRSPCPKGDPELLWMNLFEENPEVSKKATSIIEG